MFHEDKQNNNPDADKKLEEMHGDIMSKLNSMSNDMPVGLEHANKLEAAIKNY